MPGLLLSFEPDMITFDDSKEARAKMICGHVISTESMTQFLRSLISNRRYRIVCPGYKLDGKECKTEWDYKLCRQVGVLTSQENKEFETGFEENLF
jgi:predicted nucleotide-binding protein (sugar kinase/HSP70/actin superfamily)